jgi:hypothetical protein
LRVAQLAVSKHCAVDHALVPDPNCPSSNASAFPTFCGAALSRKWAVVGIQILVAVAGLATILAYTLSPHGYSGS